MLNRLRFALPCLLLVAAALCGCNTTPSPSPVANSPLPTPPPIHESTATPPGATGTTSMIDISTAVMAQTNAAPFPKGTELIGVNVVDGVATLNFNKAFNALANAGDSTESEVQKSLRATMAKFPDVQKMRVTVEGKPFDSQNTDWNTPFAVRDSASKSGGEGSGQ